MASMLQLVNKGETLKTGEMGEHELPLTWLLSWFSLLHCYFPNYKKVKHIFEAVYLAGQKIWLDYRSCSSVG